MSTILRTVASGDTAVFPVSFPYLDKSHLRLTVGGEVLAPDTDYTWVNDGEITIVAGPPVAGSLVERRRVTPTGPFTTFQPGNLDSRDLNTSSLQAIYIAEEARDVADDTAGRTWLVDIGDSGGTAEVIPGGHFYKVDGHGNLVDGGVALPLPTGGTTGQILIRGAGPDGDAYWSGVALGGGNMLSSAYDPDGEESRVVFARRNLADLPNPREARSNLDLGPAREAYRIFLTSDHQIYNTADEKTWLTATLNDIVAQKPDAVFHLGDIVDTGDETISSPTSLQGFVWDDYMDYLYAAGLPMQSFFTIAGNHDPSLIAADSPDTLYTCSNYYRRFGRPPVYALTFGNIAFIFAGYEGYASVEQIQSAAYMDQIEDFLKQFSRNYNVILCTHAPLYEAGLFDFKPGSEWFRLKPQARWKSFFDTYPIDAHFCGHSATDIITADESDDGALRPGTGNGDGGSWKTYTTVTFANGHTTSFFLCGPHIEQKNWNSAHKLGGLQMDISGGATVIPVRMRDHLAQAWVTAKDRSFPVRFPIRMGARMEEVLAPAVGPRRGFRGREEPNAGGGTVDLRKIATSQDWTNWRGGDIKINTEHLHEILMPGPNPASTARGAVRFGGRRVAETDSDLTTRFVLYGTGADGSEAAIMVPRVGGGQCWQGTMYPTSLLYPMVDAFFAGTIAQADPLTVAGFNQLVYDDFSQFSQSTGIFTCSQAGVYNFIGTLQFNGHASAFEDVVTVRFTRTRAGVDTSYGTMDIRLEPTNANSRQTITISAHIGVLQGDTVKLEVIGWASGNLNTITRAHFSADMIRSV